MFDWVFDGIREKLGKLFAAEKLKEATFPVLQNPDILGGLDTDSTITATYAQNIDFYNKMEEESPEASLALDFLSDLACQGDDVLTRGHKTIVDLKKTAKGGDRDVTTIKRLRELQKARKGKDDANLYRIYYDTFEDAKMPLRTEIDGIIKRFERRTKIKYKLRNMVRRMLKYGDNFEQILWGKTNVSKEMRISGFYNYPVTQVIINLDDYGRLDEKIPYKIKNLKTGEALDMKPGEIFRLQFNGDSESVRGKSLFMPLRKTYVRLDSLENGLVIGRMVRSHIRYLFKVDVSGMSPERALQYVKMLKEFYSKKKMVDANGKIVVTSAPLGEAEDIFFPTHKDKDEDVRVLESDPYISHIDDIMHLYNRYIAGLRITKSSTAQNSGSRNATAEQDTNPIRFVKSLQNIIRMALIDLYALELKAHGISDDVIDDMNIEMPEIDAVSTVRKFMVERIRAEIVKIHADAKVVSNHYLLENVMYLSEDEIAEVNEELSEQERKDFELAKMYAANALSKNSGNYNAPVRTGTKETNKKTGKAGNAHTTTMQAEGLEHALEMDATNIANGEMSE